MLYSTVLGAATYVASDLGLPAYCSGSPFVHHLVVHHGLVRVQGLGFVRISCNYSKQQPTPSMIFCLQLSGLLHLRKSIGHLTSGGIGLSNVRGQPSYMQVLPDARVRCVDLEQSW